MSSSGSLSKQDPATNFINKINVQHHDQPHKASETQEADLHLVYFSAAECSMHGIWHYHAPVTVVALPERGHV